MQSGSYKVTARPASTTRCCTGRQTTDQQPGHPNRGVSRKQESGHLPVADILTVERVADRPDRGPQTGQRQRLAEVHSRILRARVRRVSHAVDRVPLP